MPARQANSCNTHSPIRRGRSIVGHPSLYGGRSRVCTYYICAQFDRDYKAASEKGLGQHKRMKHRPSQLAPTGDSNSQITPEKTRISSSMASPVVLNSSSASSPVREENCRNCEALFSPGHQCGNVERQWICGAYLEAGLEMCPTCHVKRPNLCDFFSHPV